MSKEQELVSAVGSRATETDCKKKLTCAEAFEIAQEFGVEIIEVGRVCNRQKIKIRKCQLGCFG